MRYIWQHINTIINSYDGKLPLAHFLKNYFKQYPVLGSRDRRTLSAMAYSYFRCYKGLVDEKRTLEETIGACLQLCHSVLPGMEKLFPGPVSYSPGFEPNNLFPYDTVLSDGIGKEEWLSSMLVQPDFFIRLRKDKEKVTGILKSKGISVSEINDNCLALPNGAKIEELLPPDSYVVQDASSQQTGAFFAPQKNELWYDCCSGAGGKSLLLKDLEPGVKLTVSDKRESIIHNLKQRFKLYGHALPVAHVTDVADEQQLKKALGNKLFDNIICDAPCSGSGTWSRTPEQLYFFDPGTPDQFHRLQCAIAANVSKYLKPGGRLVYITCSVFRRENEEVAFAVAERSGLSIVSMQLINGVAKKADSMFAAVLAKRQ